MTRRFSLPWVLLLGSLLVAPVASAGPKEDVAAVTAKWAVTLGEDNPDTILPLYARDAVPWETASPTERHPWHRAGGSCRECPLPAGLPNLRSGAARLS